MTEERRGRIEVEGGEVAYRIVGEGDRTLLTLHGGPGAPSRYLYSLTDLAGDGLQVVFYDQLGCGESDHADDPSLWRVERFVEEAETVRDALGLGRVDLLGQSWGGMLAQEYALAHQDRLRTLILASTVCSMPFLAQEMDRLRGQLPDELQETLRRHEATGDYESPEYVAAMDEVYHRHVCRMEPYPPDVAAAFDQMAMQVYGTMWGPNEFVPSGTLKDWDVCERIRAIEVPTLLTVGGHDELTPACSEQIRRSIPHAELRVFEDSAHLSHWEERDAYMATVRDFLARH